MTAPAVFKIRSLADLERVTDSVGQVGPRTGPGKRTKRQKEWYVFCRFLEKAIPADIVTLPVKGRYGCPPREPDFVLMRPGTADVIALVEITEATDEADQREMTAFERSPKRMALVGTFGGRFPRGAARPGLAWASDIVAAIKRKASRVIFKHSPAARHLIIYPNSNASFLLSDQDDQDEQEAINYLREAIDSAGNDLVKVTNGCLVHVLGKRHICIDVVGGMRVLHR
jgi:hypothetical protein